MYTTNYTWQHQITSGDEKECNLKIMLKDYKNDRTAQEKQIYWLKSF